MSLRAPIAVLVSRFPLITETFILREIIEIERRGQPVVLVPMIRETPAVVHEAAKPWVERALFTPWMLRFPLRTLPLLLRLVAGTLHRPGTLLRTLALFPKSVWLARELERRGVRHIHAHFATHPTTMALIISSLTRIPFSFTVHAHDIQLDRSLLRWKIREAAFVRSISEFNRRFLEDQYPEARGKIEVIHVGVPIPPAPRALPPAPRVLCVAAHKPYKGLPVLIEACRILRSQGVAFHCDVVGDGPMRAELEALNHDHAVTFLGPRDENEVGRLMDDAYLFVLPSIIAPDGQMEGIPVALMEALAHGRPSVSTCISGIPELVQDGVNGLLVEPGDADALARAMRELLEDRSRAAAMGVRGRAVVEGEFELSVCTERLLSRVRVRPHPDLTDQLLALGVKPGGILVVHTAFSKVSPVEGGPAGLIAALREALGPDGTLVMPSMSDDDDHPFDATRTPCRAMGVVADAFWRMPGVLRSDNPHAFAAIGPYAAEITKPHSIDVPHGLDSPVGRAWELGGQVLLLGVGHDADTTVHLAENLAGVRYGQDHHVTILEDGEPKRVDYREVDHCCERFEQLDDWLGASQRRGIVGHATARLAESRDIVEAALTHLRENEEVFLHAPGSCEECDNARGGLV